MFSCSSLREPKTMRLFMQARRPNVELPREETGQTGILSEKVKFEQKADTIEGNTATVQDSATDIWRSVELERVDIVASRKVIKQVTMRQGSVRLEFNVKVPGVLIDSCWRVTLTPLLRTNDST